MTSKSTITRERMSELLSASIVTPMMTSLSWPARSWPQWTARLRSQLVLTSGHANALCKSRFVTLIFERRLSISGIRLEQPCSRLATVGKIRVRQPTIVGKSRKRQPIAHASISSPYAMSSGTGQKWTWYALMTGVMS